VPLVPHEAEIADLDETALRAGMIAPRLAGLAATPRAAAMQPAKGRPHPEPGDEADLRAAGPRWRAALAPAPWP
jgi:hypothetical protein